MASKNSKQLLIEYVDPTTLVPNPLNYQTHPDDQIEQLVASIKEHGIFRPIIVAIGDVILAGHGTTEAAIKMGFPLIPVHRMKIKPDSIKAKKLMIADNELSHLSVRDERGMTEILKEILADDPIGLLGTGYDGSMLAAAVMVSRPTAEIADFDAAAEWAGMPEFEAAKIPDKLIISFRCSEDRDRFIQEKDITATYRGDAVSAWWPHRERRDMLAIAYEG